MTRLVRIAIGFQVFATVALQAQRPRVRIAGDTSGAAGACSTAAAVAAIAGWFAAFQAADSAGLARLSATKSPRGFVVSMGKFTATDPFVRLESLQAVLQHARRRARQHERLTLQGVRFYGWRGPVLGFMPYFARSADDLGRLPRPGFGKAEYYCGQGVAVLNLGPRPARDPGF
jgi:hypothetical protein